MVLRELFLRVTSEYPAALSEKFEAHPVGRLLRIDIPEALRQALEHLDYDHVVKGSAGQSQWAASPWVAILDPLVTDSAQRGYYPVYLFREDFTGFYLSLNQGMMEAKQQYRSDAKQALGGRAADFRNQLGPLPPPFSSNAIALRPNSPSNNSAYYETGNICSTFYDAADVPAETSLIQDLARILILYSILSDNENKSSIAVRAEEDEIENHFIEDLSKLRQHKRIERNAKISQAVKNHHGYSCQACTFVFADYYPGVFQNKYIEAHHLVPIAELKGKRLKRDPDKDFAVLCANCHRMIHRTREPWNLVAFRQTLARSAAI